jgi:hypothetical protein
MQEKLEMKKFAKEFRFLGLKLTAEKKLTKIQSSEKTAQKSQIFGGQKLRLLNLKKIQAKKVSFLNPENFFYICKFSTTFTISICHKISLF